MGTFSKVVKNGMIVMINCYRYAISGLLGNCCRFEPTCSRYAIEAIQQHGSIKGIFLAIRRVGKCHPWHVGGIDTVPK